MKTIDNFNFKGKKALIRVDFNVPVNENFEVTDVTRIEAAKPTISKILNDGGSAILMTHFGRPKGKDDKYSLSHIVKKVSEVLGVPVHFAADCIGEVAEKAAKELKAGEVLLLENVRFYPEEEKGNEEFAGKLAKLGDIYVNDAFGTAHRAHASNVGIAENIGNGNSAVGFLVEKELKFIGEAVNNPKRPLIAILGGAKVSDKIGVIENLLIKADKILIGGAMMFTFLKAEGKNVGTSLVEDDKLDLAKDLLAKSNGKIVLPIDTVVASEFKNDAEYSTVDVDSIPNDKMGLDIGEKTVTLFDSYIKTAKTVVWNGPMGVFEMSNFAKGTIGVCESIASLTDAVTIIGGGDSAAAAISLGYADKFTHISTGGGASLEFLEGKILPGVEAISNK
mgnify:CR=1 FL=1